ncbi:MAG: hypothetical protein ACQEQ8_00705 [Pseudomonadota bacterium]
MSSESNPVVSILYSTLVLVGSYVLVMMIVTYVQSGDLTLGDVSPIHYAGALAIATVYHFWKRYRNR